MPKLRCPICEFESDRFRDYEGEYYILGNLVDHFTKNAICPNCESDMRHRFIYKFLRNYTNFETTQIRLLHFAPEKWLSSRIVDMPNIDYVPVDLNPEKYGDLRVTGADNCALPFEDSSFDAIISIHVLEHIRDDTRALKEMCRVLRNGGWAVIAVPTIGDKTHSDLSLSPSEREKMYGIDQHFRLYGTDLATNLGDVGLATKVYEVTDLDCDFADLRDRSAHIESDKYLFYAQKDTPKLSIVTVTYNAAADIEKTLKSIWAQSFTDYEVIIIDGASTDETLDIVNRHKDRIRFCVSEPDSGIYDAMNKGLARATGEFVQFLNAGDYFADNEVLADVFADDATESDLIYGDIYIRDTSGESKYQTARTFSLDELQRRGTGVLCHQAMFIRRTRTPRYNTHFRYKGELNWYFDIAELAELKTRHHPRPIVYYQLGGFGYQHFLRNRLEWIFIIYKRYGAKTLYQSRIIPFLLHNSLSRYRFLGRIANLFKASSRIIPFLLHNTLSRFPFLRRMKKYFSPMTKRFRRRL